MNQRTYRESAAAARALLNGGGGDVEAQRRAIAEALELAPPNMKHVWQRYASALAPGHRVKVDSYPLHVILPPDEALVADVESAFTAPDPE